MNVKDAIQVVSMDTRWYVRVEQDNGVSYYGGPYQTREQADARCAELREKAQ